MPADDLNFLAFIQSFRRGELIHEADALLTELVEAVRDTGSKGTLTVKIPLEMNKAGQIECVPQLELKKPRRPMGTGIYFASEEGRLTRRDPAQLDMMDELEPRRSSITDPH